MVPMFTSVVAVWADWYQGSTIVSAAVTSLHLGGVMLAGGLAVATDRATLLALARPATLRDHLAQLESTHRLVAVGLGVTIVTGLLMLAADLDALLDSAVFGAKMTVLLLLGANGWRLRRSARRLREAEPRAAAKPWRGRLGRAARASVALWFVALFLGAILPSA
jgi:hypothetical protein